MVQWKKENPNYHLEYCRSNPEKVAEYNNKRIIKNHKISSKEWKACKIYFNNSCAYCGKPEEIQRKQNEEDFHKEHKDEDGSSDLSNCIPSCTNCNCRKWAFNFDDWYNIDNEFYNEERIHKILKWINEDHKLYIEN